MVPDGHLKPHLLHPDLWVRGAVAGYFGDSWSRDPEVAGLLLEGCARFGLDGPAHGCLYQLALGEREFDGVLDLLERADSRHGVFPFSRCLGTVSLPLLRARADRISRIRSLPKSARLLVEERLENAEVPAETLWARARDPSPLPEDEPFFDGFDQARREALVEALASRELPDSGTVVRLLGSREIAGSRLEAHLVPLAGMRRLREAVPLLVERLSAEGSLAEDARVALAKIGDAEAVGLIRVWFAREEQPVRLEAAQLLGDIKSPESEEAILALLEKEDDPEVREELHVGLCGLFSRIGVEAVRAEIRRLSDPETLQLTLLPVLDVLGVETPEAEAWRRERDRLRTPEGVAEAMAVTERLHQIIKEGDEAVEESAFLQEQGRSFGWLPPQERRGRSGSDSIVRETPKIGRNEPCPCGSGRKYKFCCGKGR